MPRQGGKCSYVNCKNTPAKNRELSFFSFPVNDSKRCTQWIVNCGQDDFAKLPNNILKRQTLCSQHFLRSAFTNDLRNKLLRNHPAAVPIPWIDLEEEHCENEDPHGRAVNHEELSHIDHPISTNQGEETVEDFNNQLKHKSELNNTDTGLNNLTLRKKLIRTKKDPLDLGENTLVYEQHSERLTVGPSTSSATLSGKPQIAGSSATHSQDLSDVNYAGDDNAFLHSMEASEIEIDVDPEFETVDIKPNILLDNLPPLPPSPVPTKRRKRNSDQLETASSAAGKRSKSDQSLQRLCDFGDDDGDDDFQPDSGDDFDSEEDSAKVRRAYDLLKSVFDKKDKYDIFCNRLAGRLRGLKSPKVCRHVQQLLVTVVADAEAGRYDNVPG
ncbi:hypothetical protein LSTR_LSTR003311 [Laodelphax striatellus]|uniref:THAP-type domain-containing protein n=1 Tax=Laodelphax striatellus TaxID=195883 RepID=A0A482X686_LAOST|nr:hypothetical protein LSTR_LSTR003311 [Laodelphax striatellus]